VCACTYRNAPPCGSDRARHGHDPESGEDE
jgi:hypothetical protein